MKQIISLVLGGFVLFAATSQAQTPCRPANEPYNLENAGLPTCRTTKTVPTRRPTWTRAPRRPASLAPAAASPTPMVEPMLSAQPAPALSAEAPLVTFDSYMRENAANPLLSNHVPDYEEAFVDPPPQIAKPAKPARATASTTATASTAASTAAATTTTKPDQKTQTGTTDVTTKPSF